MCSPCAECPTIQPVNTRFYFRQPDNTYESTDLQSWHVHRILTIQTEHIPRGHRTRTRQTSRSTGTSMSQRPNSKHINLILLLKCLSVAKALAGRTNHFSAAIFNAQWWQTDQTPQRLVEENNSSLVTEQGFKNKQTNK